MGIVRRRVLLDAFKLFDLALVVCAFAAATLIVLHARGGGMPLSQLLGMRVKLENLILFVSYLVAWHIILSLFGLYESKRLSSRRSELVDIFKAISTGTLALAVMALVFRIDLITSRFLLVFWLTGCAAMMTSRLILRALLVRLRTHHRNLRCMLIVGTNRRAVTFARKIESRPELGYRVIGFADEEWGGIKEFHDTGYPLACGLENFPDLLRRTVVDEVVMGLPVKSHYFQAARIAAVCEEQGVVVRFPSSIFDLKTARSKVEDFEGDSVITLSTGALEEWPGAVKRAMDIAGSLAALIFLTFVLPVMPVVALLIKLTSPGTIFFKQKRLGLNKRVFYMYKFRTMVPDAEQRQAELEQFNEVEGPVFKIKDDPRITPIGRILRKLSIDELPQFINVLRGEMSLVGPRPLPVRDYEGFDKDWQRRRFSVRPGITCLWQVAGRSSLPFEQWMELDMEYIDTWSLWLDVKILYRTIPAVLRGSGAA